MGSPSYGRFCNIENDQKAILHCVVYGSTSEKPVQETQERLIPYPLRGIR